MIFFAVQKLLSLVRAHLFILAVVFFALGDRSKNNIVMIYMKVFCICSLLGVLWFGGLTFRSLIHFEFIFVCGVRKHFSFIVLHVAVQVSQHLYCRDCLFSIVYSRLLCQRLIDHRSEDECITGLSTWFPRSMFLFLCQNHIVLTTVAL